jgi:hypothetical protein
MKLAMVTRIGLFLAFSQGAPGWAATIFDAEKMVADAPKVAGPATLLRQGEHATHPVRLDYLLALTEARRRIGGIPRATTSLALVIASKPSAYALPLPAQSVVLVSTGMLELVGTDSKATALLGKVYGQLQMSQSLKTVSRMPSLVVDAVTADNNARQSGDLRLAPDGASIPFGYIGAPFIRRKFFADPIIGIRG